MDPVYCYSTHLQGIRRFPGIIGRYRYLCVNLRLHLAQFALFFDVFVVLPYLTVYKA